MHTYLGTVCTIFGSVSKDYHNYDKCGRSRGEGSNRSSCRNKYPSSSQYGAVTDIHSVKTLFLCMQWHGLCAVG